MQIKLPPRFKIFHNVSEDYYFIKERLLLFWYVKEGYYKDIEQQYARSIKAFPTKLFQYSSLQKAEAKIALILQMETYTPDTITLVKEID